MQKNRILSEHGAARSGMAEHVKIMLLLLAAFMINFSFQNGWKDAQGPGDDPVYIQSAYDFWDSGAVPGRITWSPGYVALMSPFVGILGKETGYKAWRFLVFLGASVMAYVAFRRMFGSAWIGATLALYLQTIWQPYVSPSLQLMLCLVLLVCFAMLVEKTRYLGLVFAILINSIYISGAITPVIAAFSILCLVFYPRLIFSARFFAQISLGLLLFLAVLGYFKYDLSSYPEEAGLRGRAGLYHQLSLYILSSGRSQPYYQPGDYDPAQGYPDEYHRHLKAIDRYYQANFGGTEHELRDVRQDKRWPLFFVDWPWLMQKDPGLMKEYALDGIKTFADSVLDAFEAIRPYKDQSYAKRLAYHAIMFVLLLVTLMVPWLVKLTKRRPLGLDAITRPSKLQMLFALSCLSIVVPLLLVKPLAIYFPPLIPLYLFAAALLATAFLRKVMPMLRCMSVAST